jgi:hypothetical protein
MKFIRNPWPYAIAGFFVLFLAGVATVIVIASRQNDTLVSKDYYEQELKFQGQIQAANRAKDVGAAIRLDAVAGKLIVSIPAEQAKQNLAGNIILYRASSSALDREVKFQPDEKGLQAVDVSGFVPGAWVVRVRWSAGGQEFFLEQKINLSAK